MLIFLLILFVPGVTNPPIQTIIHKDSVIYNNPYLFTFKNHTYLLNGDSILDLNDSKSIWRSHDLSIDLYHFVSNDSVGYMQNRGKGMVYQFNQGSFNRIDRSFDHKSHNFSYSFIQDGELMNFGGYGLNTFKNHITYFNTAKGETEVIRQKSAFSDSPSQRFRVIGQHVGSKLFVGAGYGIDPDQEYPDDNYKMLEDFWAYSFDTDEWTYLGSKNLDLTFPDFEIVTDFGNTPLVLSEKAVFEADIENNLRIDYPKANLDLIKTIHKERQSWMITYNKAKDGFYILIDKTGGSSELLFIKTSDLLGTEKVISSLYKVQSYVLYYTTLIILLLGFVGYHLYRRQSRSNVQIINSNIETIRKELKLEEFRALLKILESHPQYLNYSELMDVFPDHLGYESKKKKSRTTILNIEEYLFQRFKLKKPLFAYRKNIEDKREKQIRFR